MSRNRFGIHFVALLMTSILAVSTERGLAAQINATFGPASGNWNLAANWDIIFVPNNNVTDTFNCLLGNSDVNLDTSATIDNLSTDLNGSLAINNSRILTVVSGASAGTITNAGLITFNAAANVTGMSCNAGEVTLTGGGTLTMGNSANNRINGSGGGSLRNVNNTIQGSGAVGLNVINIVNESLIVANQTANLTIDPLATCGNTGTLRAEAGAELILSAGTYNNVGGVIEALNASTVSLSSASIVGGTLQTSGTGIIQTTTSESLDGSSNTVTNSGSVLIRNGDVLSVSGTINNTSTIDLSAIAALTFLRCAGGPVTLTGAGTVTMSNSSNNRIDATGGGSLTNVNNTIQGSGNVGVNLMNVTNQSLILANQGTSLTVDPLATCDNTGTLRAESGAELVLAAGTYQNVGGLIEALNASTVTLSGATVVGGTLQTSGTGIIQTTSVETLDGATNTVTTIGSVSIRNGDVLGVSGTLSNTGTVSISSLATTTFLRCLGGPVTLTGGGTVTMSNSANNRIDATGGGSLINVNNTITGGGAIGVNTMNVTNQALIVANQVADLTIDPLSTFDNTGTLRADAGAEMVLSAGTYNNVGGVIEALNNSIVTLSACTINGGTLQTSGTGLIQTSSSELLVGSPNPITNAGSIVIRNGDVLTPSGTLNNTGSINISSSGTTTFLRCSGGPVTLTGAGTVTMSNQANNRIDTADGSSLINENNTIQGAGSIGVNTLGITNQGSIIANQPVALTIDPLDAAGFSNEGVLQATGSGGLTLLTGTFTTSGSVTVGAGSSISRTGAYTQTAGSTVVDGTLSATGGVDIQGGTLAGNGTVSSAVSSSGIVAPGTSAGLLTVGSTYSQSSSGELKIEVGGLIVESEYDRIAVTGAATLDGTLSVELINGFAPNIGDSFTVMTYASKTGTFSNVVVPCLPGGNFLQVGVGATSVDLTVTAPTAADMNCDCAISQADVDAFALALVDPAGYVAAHPSCNILIADTNGDLLIDGRDVPGFIDVFIP
jgi:hypothetical protein